MESYTSSYYNSAHNTKSLKLKIQEVLKYHKKNKYAIGWKMVHGQHCNEINHNHVDSTVSNYFAKDVSENGMLLNCHSRLFQQEIFSKPE